MCDDRARTISGGAIRYTLQLAVECRGWQGNSSRITASPHLVTSLTWHSTPITNSTLLLTAPQIREGLFIIFLVFACLKSTHSHTTAPCPMNAYSVNKLDRAQSQHGDRLCRVIRRGLAKCRALSTKDPGEFEDSFG
jgi:hypothetical protein